MSLPIRRNENHPVMMSDLRLGSRERKAKYTTFCLESIMEGIQTMVWRNYPLYTQYNRMNLRRSLYEEERSFDILEIAPLIAYELQELIDSVGYPPDFKTTEDIINTAFIYAIDNNMGILTAIHMIKEYWKGLLKDRDYPFTVSDIFDLYYKEVGRCHKILEEKAKRKEDFTREETIAYHLKMVAPIAKRYLGLGLSLPELVSAGNLGLCYAYDKYQEKSTTTLKDVLLERLQKIHGEEERFFRVTDLETYILPMFEYGNLRKQFQKLISQNATEELISKDLVLEWVDQFIKPAKFSSVCGIYIKAFIIEEINGVSRMVKIPRMELSKQKKQHGSYPTQKTVSIHQPSPDGEEEDASYHFLDKIQEVEEKSCADYGIIKQNNGTQYRTVINKLTKRLSSTQIRMIYDYYGIDRPRGMTIKEIGEKYNIPVGTVHNHIKKAIQMMKANADLYDISFDNITSLIDES